MKAAIVSGQVSRSCLVRIRNALFLIRLGVSTDLRARALAHPKRISTQESIEAGERVVSRLIAVYADLVLVVELECFFCRLGGHKLDFVSMGDRRACLRDFRGVYRGEKVTSRRLRAEKGCRRMISSFAERQHAPLTLNPRLALYRRLLALATHRLIWSFIAFATRSTTIDDEALPPAQELPHFLVLFRCKLDGVESDGVLRAAGVAHIGAERMRCLAEDGWQLWEALTGRGRFLIASIRGQSVSDRSGAKDGNVSLQRVKT